MPMTAVTLDRTLPAARDRWAVGIAFVLGLATILGALGSQYIGELYPCELCLEQRWPYYWGLPLLGAVLLFWKRLPATVWYVAMGIATAIFVWSIYMAVYHAGVEWGFWAGPTACAGTGTAIDFGQLGNIDAARIVPCDVVQFRLFGLSLAGFNALISLAIVALLGFAMFDRWQRTRAGTA
jgi:disulfide bond formation protein DsbB